MRAGREEFHPDARSLLGRVAEVDHPALLLFFRHRIDKGDIRAHLKSFMQVEQAAMRVDHDGLAVFPELPAIGVLARRAHGYAREDAGAAPLVALWRIRHSHKVIVQRAGPGVNEMSKRRA